ncbi:MAG: SGNH/GDSL hydrolase family protein [Eubacteriales bacterium]|nr:SGNH/GDSL hydrolase family protein [Eubacteriales bacterium]MDD3883285.1 SGNH/GDSL hydrolase family protein [Eubacteriales bacterium]MDD4513923.1 SGNH/GDSL hydrolase family protein [Eubacteriales bacterium]
MLFKQGDVVLFQGDSITDWGRNREDSDSLGSGYAYIAASLFEAEHPEMGVHFLNRGVGGDHIAEMHARWQEDCIDLHPDWISILIGINDVWSNAGGDENAITAAEYEQHLREMLEDVRDKTEAGIILCEPFVQPYPEDRIGWRVFLDPMIHAVRSLAREFGARLVPFDGLLAQASALREPSYWSKDGVHPTPPGFALMAKAWLKTIE